MKMMYFFLVGWVGATTSLAQSPANVCACCATEFRQFDFWVGNWEAYQPDGKLAGRNNIVILQDSCIIQENWISAASNYTGTSYNFYNPQTGKWHQTWIDNQGGNLLLSGKLEGKNMILYSETLKNQQGEPYINRITWSPNADATVRQHWEVSKDEGKSWTTVFDGLYKKMAKR